MAPIVLVQFALIAWYNSFVVALFSCVVLVLYDQSRSAPPGLVIHTLLGDKLIQYPPKMLNSEFPDIFLDDMQNFLTIYLVFLQKFCVFQETYLLAFVLL